ncbi:SMP-30/gluconolactonase/LRE family protein [Shimia sp. R9_1]|uniref:SMP-30/gluconolactonase/LRE family protein n=1 Tax=Shimia sp. R9_1 TaxID=2821111 RepID=UPI001ADCBDCD|nr:SMP-30/gluconolactonase/LRE family protein [Shimia sp. R9_1]MBO9409818.1 SMP-30/gluconolactonase/LRE family protein [Shimia sp. R9_1]
MTRAQLYDIVKPEFRDLIHENLSLTRISSGHVWTEGPVWFPAHRQLLFSDIPNQRLCRWTPDGGTSVFRAPSNFANGNTRDLQGRLVTCQHGTRSVVRTEHDGSQKVIADAHEGKRLNSPNDVIVHSDGSIWFSDPAYGILSDLEGSRADPEQEGNFVYRVAPDGQWIRPVATDFVQPNGLAFSKDESRLYVAESGSSHDASVPPVLKVYDVLTDGELACVRDFAEIDNGLPDGLRVDHYDNVWCSANDGVHVFAPTGDLIGKVLVPERVANLTFGGERGNVLFITATTSVYSVFVNTGAS